MTIAIYSSRRGLGRIKSKQLPPEQYSMMIHNLVPFRWDPRYCVTYGELSPDMIATSPRISSSSSSASSTSTIFIATVVPELLSTLAIRQSRTGRLVRRALYPLYTLPKLPPPVECSISRGEVTLSISGMTYQYKSVSCKASLGPPGPPFSQPWYFGG